MKKFLTLCALLAGTLTCGAQTEIDNFNVGPYTVDYNGQGDVKYRLRDNIDLYEFFELERDTTIVATVTEVPVEHAIQISGRVAANRFASKEFGIEGEWKQKIGTNLYFNGGLSLAIDATNFTSKDKNQTMFEIGVPLQIELGKMNHQRASLYGIFGLAPTFYATLSAADIQVTKPIVDAPSAGENAPSSETQVAIKKVATGENASHGENVAAGESGSTNGETSVKEEKINTKKSGFLIAPSLEFGGNIPVGKVIMRIGVYATYKINCTTSGYDIYKNIAGRMFFGAKIGVAF